MQFPIQMESGGAELSGEAVLNPESRIGRFSVMRAVLAFPVKIAFAAGLLTLVLGFVGAVIVDDRFPGSFGEIWNRWDTVHYLNVARLGYSTDPNLSHLTGYLPMYPALIWIVTWLFQDALVASLVVSNVAFAVGLVFLNRLAMLDFSPKFADQTILWCALFPSAYFFHLGYTESLYLALSVGAFYFARRENWMMAGVLGLLVGMTRIPGFLLAPALVVEYLHQRNFRFRDIKWSGLWALMPFAGFGVYVGINWMILGDPLGFLEVHRKISVRELASPITGLINDWNGLLSGRPATRYTVNLQNVLAFFFTLAVLVWSAFRLRPSYTVYMALLWLITFSYSYWISVPRLILVIFPIYFFLAWLTERRPTLRYCLILAFLFPYVIGTLQFARGWWAN